MPQPSDGGEDVTEMNQQDGGVAGAWNKWSGEYFTLTGTEGDFYDKHMIIPSMLRLLGDVDGADVLDLGCGTSVFARELAGRGAKVIGVDLAEKMLARAIELEKAEPRGIDYRQGDAGDVSEFADASFDVVTCNMAIMNVRNYAGAIGHAYRVLKPGGRFVVSIMHPCFHMPGSGWQKDAEPSPDSPTGRHWRVDHYFERRSTDAYAHRTLGDYLGTVLSTGFSIVGVDEPEPWPKLAMRHPDSMRVAGYLVLACGKT